MENAKNAKKAKTNPAPAEKPNQPPAGAPHRYHYHATCYAKEGVESHLDGLSFSRDKILDLEGIEKLRALLAKDFGVKDTRKVIIKSLTYLGEAV